jgi:hypothetical protein
MPFGMSKKNQVGMELNGTHQLLIFADDVNILGDNVDTIKKNTQTLIDASKEVSLEVNPEKTKYEGWNFNNGNTAVETPCNGTK